MTAEHEPREPHPLEGKYLVFQYEEADEIQEERFMLLYLVKGGKLQGIITPFDFGTKDSMERNPTERGIAYLQHFGISEVTVADFRGNSSAGLGIEYGESDTFPEEFDEDPDKDEVENWSILSILEEGGEEHRMLIEAGIRVNYVDMRSDKVKASHKLVSDFLGVPQNRLPFQPQE